MKSSLWDKNSKDSLVNWEVETQARQGDSLFASGGCGGIGHD